MAGPKFDAELEGGVFGAIKDALKEDEDPAAASDAVREADDAEKKAEEEKRAEGAEAGGDDDAKKTADEAAAKAKEESDAAAGKKADDDDSAGAGAEKKDGDEEAAPPEAPKLVKFRALGADRQYDLTKKDDLEEMTRRLSLSFKVDDVVAQHDEKVKERVTEHFGGWLDNQKIVVPGEDGKAHISVDGAVGWALRLARESYGPEGVKAFHAAVAKMAAEPDVDDLSVAGIDAEMKSLEEQKKGLDADLDADQIKQTDARLKDLRRTKALASRLEALPKTFKDTVAPLDERFAAADKERTQGQMRERSAVLDRHLDAELAKYQGFKESKTFRRVQIIDEAKRLYIEATQGGKPITHEQALTSAAAAYAGAWQDDLKADRERNQKESDRLRRERNGPKNVAPSPGAKGGPGPSGSDGKKPKTGSQEWLAQQAERLAALRAR
jgi:hypothetical protein